MQLASTNAADLQLASTNATDLCRVQGGQTSGVDETAAYEQLMDGQHFVSKARQAIVATRLSHAAGRVLHVR